MTEREDVVTPDRSDALPEELTPGFIEAWMLDDLRPEHERNIGVLALRHLASRAESVRERTIEECAKVADIQSVHAMICAANGLRGAKESATTAKLIAANIRALPEREQAIAHPGPLSDREGKR